MGKVVLDKTISLDGYIAGPNDDVARLFAWYDGKPSAALKELGDPLQTTGAVVMVSSEPLDFSMEGSSLVLLAAGMEDVDAAYETLSAKGRQISASPN